MGTLERKWGPFGDPKAEKGPHGDPGPQMGTHLGAVLILLSWVAGRGNSIRSDPGKTLSNLALLNETQNFLVKLLL